MELELASETVHRLEVLADPLRGITPDMVINLALDVLEKKPTRTNPPQESAEQLIERFRRYRGSLSGITIEEIVAARHEGLP